MIRLETSQGRGIDNVQSFDVSTYDRNFANDIPRKFPRAQNRTPLSPLYNCHGLTFASRRTRIIDNPGIDRILDDDKWSEIPNPRDVLPGDIVIYFGDDGDPNHSGIIVSSAELGVPMICSKWGNAGEYVHRLNDCPLLYGPNKKFYRCRL